VGWACASGSSTVDPEGGRVRAHPPTVPVRRAGSAALTARTRLSASLAAFVVASAAAAAGFAPVAAAAPSACGGAPQIVDVADDGHHPNTDVVAAWFSEQAGRLQVTIQPRDAVWEPVHDDSEAAGFAFLFELGGVVRYVRAEAPRAAPVRFDHGTWSEAGGFVSAGPTTGVAETGPGGAVTIDVPATTAAVAGAVLRRTFVLTYDGATGAEAHWVDRGPGGVTPAGDTFGADFVVGSCTTGRAPGEQPGPLVTTAVTLARTPARLVGGRTIRFAGTVAPPRAGVPVTVTLSGRRAVRRTVVTDAEGRWSARLAVRETSTVRASTSEIASTTRMIAVRSRTRISVRRLDDGDALIVGRVRPKLPGRVLWLAADAVRPIATARVRDGRFRLRIANPRPGRYQAVSIPLGNRAERSTSNTGVIR
jgi:hypothetical protein